MDLLGSLWDVLVVFFWAFVFISSLFAFIMVVSDLIRDRALNGWWKALWILFLVFLPLITTLIYLIARGDGMAERAGKEAKAAEEATEKYIREVAGGGAADEIAKAKGLLDAGAITPEEFSALKARVIAG